jgi:hypothetical protein
MDGGSVSLTPIERIIVASGRSYRDVSDTLVSNLIETFEEGFEALILLRASRTILWNIIIFEDGLHTTHQRAEVLIIKIRSELATR